MEIVLGLILFVLQLTFVLMLLSMIMSWVDMEQRFAFTRAIRGLVDPLIAPFRQIIPRVGFLDLSFFVGIILLQIMISLVKSAGVAFVLLPF